MKSSIQGIGRGELARTLKRVRFWAMPRSVYLSGPKTKYLWVLVSCLYVCRRSQHANMKSRLQSHWYQVVVNGYLLKTHLHGLHGKFCPSNYATCHFRPLATTF